MNLLLHLPKHLFVLVRSCLSCPSRVFCRLPCFLQLCNFLFQGKQFFHEAALRLTATALATVSRLQRSHLMWLLRAVITPGLAILIKSLLVQHILKGVSLIMVSSLGLRLIDEIVIGRGESLLARGILVLAWVLSSIRMGANARSLISASLRVISLSVMMVLVSLLV